LKLNPKSRKEVERLEMINQEVLLANQNLVMVVQNDTEIDKLKRLLLKKAAFLIYPKNFLNVLPQSLNFTH
jgi:hypothetical protein